MAFSKETHKCVPVWKDKCVTKKGWSYIIKDVVRTQVVKKVLSSNWLFVNLTSSVDYVCFLTVEAKPMLWCDIIDKFKLDLKKLIKDNLDQILSVITSKEPATKVCMVAGWNIYSLHKLF